jgi:hypothetical protein
MAKLIPSRHSFRLQPHHRTSYGGLALILLIVGVFLLFISEGAHGDVVNPQSGAIGIAATVPGPAPSQGATILSPSNGSHTSTIPITVSGTCPAGLIISIYSNDIFVGSTICTSAGGYSLQINLFDGQNSLVAKDTDALGQNGPDSAAINVTYDAPSLALPGSSILGRQLFLESTTPTRGGSPGASIPWQVTIVGGTAPYALSWNWGDGSKTTLVSEQFEGPVTTIHTYARAGTYRVIAQVTDAAGNSAFLQMVMVVNGPITAAPSTTTKIDPSLLASIWPVYILACLFVLTFFIGEKREVHKLRKLHLLVSSL